MVNVCKVDSAEDYGAIKGEVMAGFEALGYCGVDCSACADLASGACPGCRKSVWPDDDPCPPVACCKKRGIEVCGQCAEFPCAMMTDFYGESESHQRAGELMRKVFAETFC